MKNLYLITFSLLLATISIAAPTITAVSSNGNWINNSTWDLNRVPANGDTVIIPTGKTVVVNTNENPGTLFIKVYGTLRLFGDGGILTVDNGGTIKVFTGGNITSSGSPSAQVRIGNQKKYQGNEPDVNGPMIADKTTGPGFVPFIEFTLPVRFISFNVARQNNNILVEWATAEESNSSYYEIERSENGINWTGIGIIKAAGNSSAINKYSFIDKNIISKIVYYRIKQVDADGKFVETSIRMIKMQAGTATIKITAASSNSIYVHFSEQVKANVMIRVASISGQIVSQQTINQPVGQVIIPSHTNTRGIYVVTVSDGQNLTISKSIVL
jgi:G8 domain